MIYWYTAVTSFVLMQVGRLMLCPVKGETRTAGKLERRDSIRFYSSAGAQKKPMLVESCIFTMFLVKHKAFSLARNIL